MKQSEQINELAAALAEAQAELRGAEKNATNPHFKNEYANLQSIWHAVRDPLTKRGLSVLQLPIVNERGAGVENILTHKSGQWIASECVFSVTRRDPQGEASAITYAKRYSLLGIAGIAPVDESDDDGNAASSKPSGKVNTTPPAPKPTSTPTAAPKIPEAILALKPGETCDINGKFASYTAPKAGKPLGVLKLQGDDSNYACGCDLSKMHAGDSLTITAQCHETETGIVWYEATEVIPF